MKSYVFLFWAYNVVWIGLAGYMLWIVGRLRRLDGRIESLERELAARENRTAK